MAADKGLIDSMKGAYSAPIGDITPILQGIERLRAENKRKGLERRKKEEDIQNKIAKYQDQYPPGIPLSKIPEKYRSSISDFSFKIKDKYNDAVVARSNMKAGTDEYTEQTNVMNNSLQSLNNLKNQWNVFGAGKEDYIADFDSNNYSSLNNMGNISKQADLYTDKYDVEIGEEGDLMFKDEGGSSFSLNDIEEPFMKAAEEAMYIESQFVKAHDKGVKLSNASVDFTMSQIRKVITKGGLETLKSLAVDDLVANISLYDPSDEIFERIDSSDSEVSLKARDELEQKMLKSYRDVLVKQSQEGYNVKNPVKPKPPTSMEVLTSKFEMFDPLLASLEDKELSSVAKTELQKNLNMQILRYTDYYAQYDEENNKFYLYDKNEKEGFRDEGADYPATAEGVIRMLKEIDQSRL